MTMPTMPRTKRSSSHLLSRRKLRERQRQRQRGSWSSPNVRQKRNNTFVMVEDPPVRSTQRRITRMHQLFSGLFLLHPGVLSPTRRKISPVSLLPAMISESSCIKVMRRRQKHFRYVFVNLSITAGWYSTEKALNHWSICFLVFCSVYPKVKTRNTTFCQPG